VATVPATEGVLTVSALSRMVKESLEAGFPAVWVKGEVTGFTRSDRGHVYFSLKEGRDAVLDCAMWRNAAIRLSFEPQNGAEVEAFGRVSAYAARSRYQLIVEEVRPSGLGALLLALEELKRRLQAEGLFDPARKRALPAYPQRIGLVTSPIGAAVRDLVKVLRARWPAIGIVLAPVNVQGRGAAEEVAAAIERFNRWGRVDLLIVGRGGGSLEDLWAFNEESVVRAIAASAIPVISAVGHEVDWTLADLAADVRAATPSNAAELAVRDRAEVARRLESLAGRATRAMRGRLDDRRRHLTALIEKYGFRRQRDALGFLQQRIDALLERLRGTMRARARAARERLTEIGQRYGLRQWPRTLSERRARASGGHERLLAALVSDLHARRTRLGGYADRLRALSPRLVLERGFCIVRASDGSLVRAAASVAVGERVALEFARGAADARIEAVRPGGNDGIQEDPRG
jgi:exodeoxyribonuclease VII large subunit